MNQPRLFGTSKSRALRALWGMEEVGIPFEHVPTGYGAESKAPEYLEVNPNGRIPALIDGELRLFESMAINLYLSKRYGATLYPAKPEDEARAWMHISVIVDDCFSLIVDGISTPSWTRGDARKRGV